MHDSFLHDVVPLWLQRVAVHQDYAWFVSLVLWGLLLLAWWRHPHRAEAWGWLPAVAIMAIGTVAVQFMIFDPTFDWFQDRLVPGTTNIYVPAVIEVELLGDFLLGAGWAAVAAWWWWRGAARRTRRGWRWAGLPLAAWAAGTHFARPEVGAWALAAVVTAGAAWSASDRSRWMSRVGLAGAAGLMWFSTVGPLAVAAGGLQRLAAATPWGLLAAALQIGLGAILLGWVGRESLMTGGFDEEERGRRRREWRWFAAAATAWLVFGLGYVYRVGYDNRNELQRNRLRSVAAEAMVFRTEVLLPLVGERLQLERVEVSHREREPRALRAAILASPEAQDLRWELNRIVVETPFLDSARILVAREGLLIELASSRLPPVPERVEVLRELTPADRAALAAAQPYIEHDVVGEIDDPYFCRAPIVTRDGRVLGWLDYVRREFFQSLARKWRVGPLAVVALGLVAGFMVLLQRRSVREQERAWRRAAAETEANRLKSTFIAKVSHELRTPLQSLLGYSELLEQEAADDHQRRRLARLREHGDLLLRIVNDLLDLSAIEAGRLHLLNQPVELDRLVESVVESLRGRTEEKRLALSCSIAPGLRGRWCETDSARVRQIVFNLVGNAVKFTDQGAVVVRLNRVDEVGVGAEAGAAGSAVRLRLEVEDTGPGIDESRQAELFAPFARLEATAGREGSGLGLAMVAALARLMGGAVGVRSRPGAGSTFWTEWTARLVAAPAFEREADAGEGGARLDGLRVLIAEDNPLVRDLFLSVLAERGARCEAVADGESALQAALATRYDGLVLDVNLPGISGVEVARRLRAPGVTPGPLRIIGASAHAGSEDAALALAAGMDVFLTKPVSLSALCSALAGAAGEQRGSGSPFSPSGTAARRRLVRLFRADAGQQWRNVSEAFAATDPSRLRRAVHYLANSAAAVEDQDLLQACRTVERLLNEQAPTASNEVLAAAIGAVERAIAPWCSADADAATVS